MPFMQRPSRAVATAGAPGRNDPCPCGSGRKYKHCCAGKQSSPVASAPMLDGLDQVRKLRDAGRFLEAAQRAEEHVRRRPTDASGHAALGSVHLYAGRAADAAASFSQAVRLAPANAQHHHDLGFALETLGRDAEAVSALRRAVALDPRHAEALERLGVMLLDHGRREEAIDCFRRVANVEGDSVLGWISRAKVLLEEGKRDEVAALLTNTIERFPANTEAKRFLAAILREQGRFDEAIPLLEAATEGSPAQAATAYFDIAMSKRITDDDQLMLRQMKALLDYRALSDTGRQRVHFALGKASDDLGDPASAMRHFDAGNRLAARARPFDRGHFGASVHRLMTSTTEEFFQQHRGLGSASELPVLILGMPRSGTTLVEQIVSSHPEVGAGDELPFWNRTAEEFAHMGDSATAPDHVGRVAAGYLEVLRALAPEARRVTDKMPGNYLWIGLFHLVFPSGRVIHCRRNPVDTCLSNYFTNFSSPLPFTYEKGHLAFYYKCYRRLMAHWRTVLPPGSILDVDYEELVADRERISRRMIDFLGLDWDDACLRPQDNQRIVRTASMWQARQPVYRTSTERWRRYEPWLGELAELLDDARSTDMVEPVSDSTGIPAARRLRDAGRFDEAIAALQKSLKESPHDPVLYCEIGVLCMMTDRPDSAGDCFERAVGLNPNFAAAHYNLGAALERQGRPADAVVALRKAIALKPDLGAAYSRLGNLLLAQRAQDQAKECFRRAAELLTDPAEHDLEEAKLLVAEGRTDEAKPLLRGVIALAPGNSLAHAILGDLLGQEGDFAEAAALLRRATELEPDRVGAWHNLTILTKISAADRTLVDAMEEMLKRPGRSDFDRAMLHFALGKAYDDLGQADPAMRHFDQGNALERRKLNFDRAALAESVDRAIATFPPTFFAGHAAPRVSGDLPLLVVGMPRSGTTLVEQIVSAHPAITAGGELTFWTDNAADFAPAAAPRLAAEYLAVLRRIGAEAIRVTDKNPFNFLHLGMIHLALPEARVIHCRRDPIDTCLSIYFTRFATPQSFASERGDLVFYYRQYARLMAHWRAVLPAERFFEIDYEALTEDRDLLTRRMIDFCGVPWNDACLAPESNQRLVRTASVWQARQPVYRTSVARWRRYEPWLGELADLRASG